MARRRIRKRHRSKPAPFERDDRVRTKVRVRDWITSDDVPDRIAEPGDVGTVVHVTDGWPAVWFDGVPGTHVTGVNPKNLERIE